MFYILSLKYPPVGNCARLWGPGNNGYVCDLDLAGRYTPDQIRTRPGYYDNAKETIAVPCEVIDAAAVRHIRHDSETLLEIRARAKAHRTDPLAIPCPCGKARFDIEAQYCDTCGAPIVRREETANVD